MGIQLPKTKVEDLPPEAKKVFYAIVSELCGMWFKKIEEIRKFGLEMVIEKVVELMSHGLMKIGMNEEGFFLEVYDENLQDYKPVGQQLDDFYLVEGSENV